MQTKLKQLQEFNILNGIDGAVTKNTMPYQLVSEKKKTSTGFLQQMADYFYHQARKQAIKNTVFTDVRKMTEGEFVYRAVDLEKTLHSSSAQDFAKLTSEIPLTTHLKHFDFLGIMANAIKSVFGDLDDLYRVQSNDDCATNEYIRMRTQKFQEYGQKKIEAEIKKMLVLQGFDPDKKDFKTEEEKQQYIQQLDAETQKLSPEEVEKELARNFKVVAIEWANNVLQSDKESEGLEQRDKQALVDFILTGRWFRHYRMGFDSYIIEDWAPENVFISQELDLRYPQNADYVGTLVGMTLSQAMSRYGHLMNTKQQEELADYWGNKDDFKTKSLSGIGVAPFGENLIMPFKNYQDHQINLQIEEFVGAPLAQTMDEDGQVHRHYMPRSEFDSYNGTNNYKNQRTDIDVRNDLVDVLEAYWTSMKRIGVLVYRNDFGALDLLETTDDLLKDFIVENEIKVKRNVSMSELQSATLNGNLEEYENTISYHHLPESRHMVVIKSKNSITIKDDIILDGNAIIQQIKGNSNYYEVRHPVGGIISKSPITKAFPYQQMYNVCLNQITELIHDEIGTFYTIDINGLPDEYKGETTEETINTVLNTLKLTKILPVDLSRANLSGSTVYPNMFQKNEIVFQEQVTYRQSLGEYYYNKGMAQLGVSPQLLGAPNNHVTAEGVKQQATATYALISNYVDEFNQAKAKSNELHIAIAQQCEVNGKSSTRLIQKSDGANSFIDILAQDPEYFPFRRLSVLPASSSKDRAKVKMLQEMLINDNTIQKDFADLTEIVLNPYVTEIRQVGKEMRERTQQMTQQQREFEGAESTKQIEARVKEREDLQLHERDLADIKGQWGYKEAYLTALGRDSASTTTDDFAQLTQAFKLNLQEDKQTAEMGLKSREIDRKEKLDSSNRSFELDKLKLKEREIESRNQISRDKITVAGINPT